MAKVEIRPLPPEEAVRLFAAKYDLRGFDWRDVWEREHAAAFTVAKAMRLDVLRDIREAVAAAIDEGATPAQFRERIEPALRAKGWWGRQRMVDPLTGEERIVQLGSPGRLRVILDTNLRTSYAAGRWERIERVAAARPYLRYVAVLDERTRPEHAAWHDTVLPVDDPWWRTHYPPNGWNCRCMVQQLSDADLARRGLTPSPAPAQRTREWRNPRTGQVIRVPEGIDPGFGYNAGRAAAEAPGLILAQKLDEAPAAIAAAGAADVVASAAFERFVRRPVGVVPVAVLDEALRGAIGTSAQAVRLSAETAAKQLRRHAEASAAAYRALQLLLTEGDIVREGAGRLIASGLIAGAWWRAVVKATGDGREIYLSTLHRSTARQAGRMRSRGEMVRRAPGGP